jgi:hypothetical protein
LITASFSFSDLMMTCRCNRECASNAASIRRALTK